VLRATIHASESSDVEGALAPLRAQCARAELSPMLADAIYRQTSDVLSNLMERGKQLASMGSQMHVTREIAGEGYSIKLVFGAGAPRSVLSRLTGGLLGR
jgi:hypothetical protein